MTVRVLFSNLARPGHCASVVKKVKAMVLESGQALLSVLESVLVSALESVSGQALLSVLESVLVSALESGQALLSVLESASVLESVLV